MLTMKVENTFKAANIFGSVINGKYFAIFKHILVASHVKIFQ